MADATLDLATVWDQIRERLATSLSPQQNAMLNLTRPLGLVEDTALLAAPNEFAKDVLDSRLRPVIAQALSAAYGRDIRVAVTVQPAPADTAAPEHAVEALYHFAEGAAVVTLRVKVPYSDATLPTVCGAIRASRRRSCPR